MGSDASKVDQQAAPMKVAQVNKSQPIIERKNEVYEGIETIDPLIIRQLATEKFPNDIIKINSGELPDAHKMVVDYFRKISTRINKNEQQITTQIRKQLEEYIGLSAKLEKRQDELNIRLAKILALFRTLDDEVKNATDSLKATIDQADAIAAQIDPEFMKFKEFRNQ